MRLGLAVNRVGLNRKANLAGIMEMAEEAAANRAQLVLFPEAAITGLVNNDDPEHDLSLGETTRGAAIRKLCQLSSRELIWIGIGFLERSRHALYDSAILINPRGSIVLKYRRVSPGWHGKEANPNFYRQGGDVPVAKTSFGRIGFLICGDLFDDRIVAGLRAKRPDLVLFPFARNFEDGRWDVERWEREEKWVYAERARAVGSYVAMVNYLSELDGAFGGAMIVSPKGDILYELVPGASGILFGEIKV